LAWTAARADELKTVAERSDFRATARHADVVQFCERLAKASPVVRLGELGRSVEGRSLPLVVLADPPLASAEEAAKSGKLVVFAMGNIHAGEVDGKEALLMLARDIATASDRPLLKDLVLIFAPIFNADGNERMSKTSRPGQLGPEEGQGVRTNAQGLDLNRDFIKLETPEVRSLVRFLNRWDPAIVIDTHTTNGSKHRYTITYDGPRHPAADARIIAAVRDDILPDVTRRFEASTDYKAFFYGNFSTDRTQWKPYPAEPRYGTQYVGLRNRISILCESYSYAPYRNRVLATRDFVRACFDHAAENKDKIRKLLAHARPTSDGRDSRPPTNRRAGRQSNNQGSATSTAQTIVADTIPIAHRLAPASEPVTVLGFGERAAEKGAPHDYRLEHLSRTEPTVSVTRPFAYLFPATLSRVVENLQRHGIEVDELREDIELDLQIHRVDKLTCADREFQGHRLVKLETTSRDERRRVPAGTIVVRTAQPLGALVVNLLEPRAEDGLATWNSFDDLVAEGNDAPVLRLASEQPITVGRVPPLADDRPRDRPITFDVAYPTNGPPLSFAGSPVNVSAWLDADHFLQTKAGRLLKVHATTGRSEPFLDPEKLAAALASLDGIDKNAAETMSRRAAFQMNPQRTGALFDHAGDLYYARFDGSAATRLTKSKEPEELASFSPSGEIVAFVRENNLFVIDIATQKERKLTDDGSELVSNGKADWVYFEEIFNRDWRAYWWAPDSSRIAFVRYDDTPVHTYTVLDLIPTRQTVEATRYPKAGDPNPLVRLGIAPVDGSAVAWVDTSEYDAANTLLDRAFWTPDSQRVFFYVQDRAQKWLDICAASPTGGRPTKLLRETTGAWVDDPGELKFLADGSFLLPSERTGWKHLYHYDRNGKPIRTVTGGEWEARDLHHIDESTGWLFFSGTRDSHIGSNLYRVKLDGTGLERITDSSGTHRVELNPTATLFVDTWSDHRTPTQVRLHRTDGSLARTIDSNPVYAIEAYRLGEYQLVQVPLADGFVLEGSLLKPPGFDERRKYPVWFKTYGGPHAPTVRDAWVGGMVPDQMLANLGFIVFRCDPRPASGKGARATWTAYKQLGVEELKDIEAAIRWLIDKHPYVDAARIGMSGHSYGGFMTAYAMTHSKLFAAGIAGAPVTDWHNYDTIYTERYMDTPQNNRDGYERSSVVKAANNLHGRLLILHGIMDDNVHLANTVQLVHALQQADKDFEVMFYPRARHGIFGRHYQRLMVDFILRTLGEPAARGADTK
jgi:dipeptidyl aminopeptidase/acylaminoacyl peptidase